MEMVESLEEAAHWAGTRQPAGFEKAPSALSETLSFAKCIYMYPLISEKT